MIAVVDSGVANLASVMAALQRLGGDAIVTSNADALAAADRAMYDAKSHGRGQIVLDPAGDGPSS